MEYSVPRIETEERSSARAELCVRSVSRHVVRLVRRLGDPPRVCGGSIRGANSISRQLAPESKIWRNPDSGSNGVRPTTRSTSAMAELRRSKAYNELQPGLEVAVPDENDIYTCQSPGENKRAVPTGQSEKIFLGVQHQQADGSSEDDSAPPEYEQPPFRKQRSARKFGIIFVVATIVVIGIVVGVILGVRASQSAG